MKEPTSSVRALVFVAEKWNSVMSTLRLNRPPSICSRSIGLLVVISTVVTLSSPVMVTLFRLPESPLTVTLPLGVA